MKKIQIKPRKLNSWEIQTLPQLQARIQPKSYGRVVHLKPRKSVLEAQEWKADNL